MTSLIQISDTHFGTEQAEVVEALVRLVHRQAPDLVVLSGDITQRARRVQFRAARTFVDRLNVPATLVIPGNHDIPLFNLAARGFDPYGNYSEVFGTNLEPEFESEDLLVLCVKTTRRYRHKNGEVSTEQINRVARRLGQATKRQIRIVVTHQPVHVIEAEDEGNLLRGHENAVPVWADAGADLVLGGHIHLPYVRGLHLERDGLARRLWAVQAGTAISRRLRKGTANSINLIRSEGDGNLRFCTVERWDYAPSVQSFEQVARDALPCDTADIFSPQ